MISFEYTGVPLAMTNGQLSRVFALVTEMPEVDYEVVIHPYEGPSKQNPWSVELWRKIGPQPVRFHIGMDGEIMHAETVYWLDEDEIPPRYTEYAYKVHELAVFLHDLVYGTGSWASSESQPNYYLDACDIIDANPHLLTLAETERLGIEL